MEALFIAKLLTVAGPQVDQTMYDKKFKHYKKMLSSEKLNEASQNYAEKKIPIPPEMQLVFNFEMIMDEVYKRAKRDTRLEIMTELEVEYNISSLKKTNKIKNDKSEKKNKMTIDFSDLL
jgi:hypothetical protein